MTERPRIAIDARYLSHGLVGGVRTYLKNLATELVRLDGPEEFIFWIDSKAPLDPPELADHATIRKLDWRSPLSSMRIDQRLGSLMRDAGADLIHFPANYGVAPGGMPAVITLHDVINLLPLKEILRGHRKNPQTVLTMSYLSLMSRRSIRRQPLIITVSDHSRREIIRRTGLSEERVIAIHSAPESCFQKLHPGHVEYLRERHKLRERVIVADAIKNPDATLDAYRLLPAFIRESTSLVFFSRAAPSEAVIAAERAGECVVLLRPDQETLVHLFNLADIFVFPSWYEGFGLPVVESMACGTPVVASDRGSIPEIIGDAGMTAGADDGAELAARIGMLLESEGTLRKFEARALRRAADFTWNRTALATRDVYRTAMESCAASKAHSLSCVGGSRRIIEIAPDPASNQPTTQQRRIGGD